MDIPYMVGATSHDMAPAILHLMTKKWAVKNGAYLWHFARMLPVTIRVPGTVVTFGIGLVPLKTAGDRW
jgi:hypothetical protein